MLGDGLNPGVACFDWKRSAGWLESWEGLLFAKSTDSLDQLKIFKNPGEWFYSCLQETNTLWQTTWPNVLRSYFTQSDYCTNLDKKSPNCWHLTRQFDWRNNSIWTLFLLRTTAAQTSLNATLTSNRTTHTPLQPLYPTWGTSETIAPILWPYNIRVAHKPMFTYSLMPRTKTNLKTDQEHFTRSNAPPARSLKLVWPAET